MPLLVRKADSNVRSAPRLGPLTVASLSCARLSLTFSLAARKGKICAINSTSPPRKTSDKSLSWVRSAGMLKVLQTSACVSSLANFSLLETILAVNFSNSLPPRWAIISSRSLPSDEVARSSATCSRSWADERSSSSVNWGVTPASSGKRRSSEAQKEWIVWMRRPPGVSIALAKRRRAFL